MRLDFNLKIMFAKLFATLGIFDQGITMVYDIEPHTNLEVSPRAEVIMGKIMK